MQYQRAKAVPADRYTPPLTQSSARKVTSSPKIPSRQATISWYGRFLIFGTILIAVGWELFRVVLAIITLD